MTEYYLDIETEGLNPKSDKIITIQYQKLGKTTGRPLGKLTILQEWKSSEEQILNKFLPLFLDNWTFVPIGSSLAFDFRFIKARAKKIVKKEIPWQWLFHGRPYLDLKPILIIWNRGNFKLSGLNSLLDMPHIDIEWYKNKQYDKIIGYIKQEAENFIDVYQTLKREIPKIELWKG